MPSTVKKLVEAELIKPPQFLADNIHYEVLMGSVAYGVSTDTSDIDMYGFAVPPKEVVFPHLAGEIDGFGRQKQKFEQYQQHHIKSQDEQKEYDISIYNIVKYFSLCMENNPNMIDSLFVPQTCVLHITALGNMVRESRNLFLHKGCFHKLKGYAYSQLHKMSSKNPIGKRKALVEKHGYDTKFGYNVVRLLSQCEQILLEGTLDLQEKGRREHMKAVRNGEVSEEEVRKWASEKELQLERLYHSSKLQHSPPESKIKDLLLQCLEHHYGSLSKVIERPDKYQVMISKIKDIIAED